MLAFPGMTTDQDGRKRVAEAHLAEIATMIARQKKLLVWLTESKMATESAEVTLKELQALYAAREKRFNAEGS